ncbi:TRAF-type zinc finger domain-containing protein 1 [Calypte anna]|uniref:TRAF-type zinc finger domain-containing protein 1 n=1 Tax=Calypte anna TaxID=9244 RepID=UPI0011C44EC0|nr:TRAF-type zinc finger domain-containing protein 1 [Calypte anna]
MAIAAVSEAETRLCGNCQKDVPLANFIMHEIHCSRNIEVCSFCSESVPKSEMKNHIESEHVEVTCKCQMKIEKCLLKDHEASACPLRPALCRYCDIQLSFSSLQEHETYCGARTERCGGCGRNVLVKDLKEHPGVCGQEAKGVRGGRSVPCFEDEEADLEALRVLRNRLRAEDELEQLERIGNTHSSLYGEWNDDLDYVLALSLQNENNPHSNAAAEIPSDLWDTYYTKESVPKSDVVSCDSSGSFSRSNYIKSDEAIMLPCEFCEELYPAEDLILHQTGCNPASAFASFSKRSSLKPQKYGGLCDAGSKSHWSLSSSQPQAVQAEGDIMIPCEFCGIQLEEEILFHHQHHCDLRPASPAPSSAPQQLLPPQNNRERRGSPELAPRRLRHQGDVSPWSTEDFGQQRLSYPPQRTKLLGNTANARSAPLSSSAKAHEVPNSRGKPRKAANGEGRLRNRGVSEATGETTPCVRSSQNFHPEAFTSSFSRTSPTQTSTSTRGGRGLGTSDAPVGSRRRNTKAKAQSPASDYPKEK